MYIYSIKVISNNGNNYHKRFENSVRQKYNFICQWSILTSIDIGFF